MEFNEFFREQNASASNGGMRFIESFYDGMRVADIYLVKTKNAALTKNGKEYLNVTLQDCTGQVDAKVWEPNSPGIAEFAWRRKAPSIRRIIFRCPVVRSRRWIRSCSR